MTPINNKYAQTLEHRIKRLGDRELPSNDPLLSESVLILAKTIADIADDARSCQSDRYPSRWRIGHSHRSTSIEGGVGDISGSDIAQ